MVDAQRLQPRADTDDIQNRVDRPHFVEVNRLDVGAVRHGLCARELAESLEGASADGHGEVDLRDLCPEVGPRAGWRFLGSLDPDARSGNTPGVDALDDHACLRRELFDKGL